MKFSKFSKEMVAELLNHLAENEPFGSVKNIKGVSKADIQDVLIELSDYIKANLDTDAVISRKNVNRQDLTDSANQVISSLNPKEEETLLQSFKISE